MFQRNAKKTVDFPVNAAIAFYFNQGHSSISKTKLRLFLKQFDFDNCYPQGILFLMRTKKNISRKIVKKIKSSVKYQDLIEDTKGLLSIVKYDLGRDEDLLLTGKSRMNGLGGA